MAIPTSGFVILITRERNERRLGQTHYRYRTVGRYECYLNGALVTLPDLHGATVEPRGPGNNGKTGKNEGRRIEAGTYRLATHGTKHTKYHSFNYHSDKRPRPAIYVLDTDKRSAILIHQGVGFKSTVGCINLTGSIVGPHDNIGPGTSFGRLNALIEYMKHNISGFPTKPGQLIDDAMLVIEGEP